MIRCGHNLRLVSLAAVGTLSAFTLAAVAVQAQSGFDAIDKQQTLGGDAEGYFRVVNVDWPFYVAAETCEGEQSDYYVVLEGPLKLEGGQYHATAKAEIAMRIIRDNQIAQIINGVFATCTRCPSADKRNWVAEYDVNEPPTWFQIIHDTVNDRYGFYYGGSGGSNMTNFQTLTEAEVGTDRIMALIVGGQVEGDSELGPFLHEPVIYKTTVSSNWGTFQPDDVPPGRNDQDLNGLSLLALYYYWSTGGVKAWDYGFTGCP